MLEIKDSDYEFTKLDIERYSQLLASSAHIPGGGSVSGICGVFAYSLLEMVLSISVPAIEEDVGDVDLALEGLKKNRERLLRLVNLDSKNFDILMNVFKMPNVTEDEKVYRRECLRGAFQDAAYAPFMIYKLMCDLENTLEKFKLKIKQSVKSDFDLSNSLLNLVKLNCIDNIKANKLSLEQCEILFDEVRDE